MKYVLVYDEIADAWGYLTMWRLYPLDRNNSIVDNEGCCLSMDMVTDECLYCHVVVI